MNLSVNVASVMSLLGITKTIEGAKNYNEFFSKFATTRCLRVVCKCNQQSNSALRTRKVDQEGNICKFTSKGKNIKRVLLSMIAAVAIFAGSGFAQEFERYSRRHIRFFANAESY